MNKRRNFKDSIRRMFIRYTFVPISLLFVLFLLFTILNARLTLVNQTKEAGKTIRSSLEEVYHSYENEINRVALLPPVIDFVESGHNGQLVYEEFYDFNNRQQVRSIMHILNAEGDMIASSANSNPELSDNVLKEIYIRMSKASSTTLSETNYVRYSHDRYTVYSFGKSIEKQGKRIGYVIYQLYEEDFQKLIFVQNNEISIVTDQYNTVIATTNNVVKGLLNKFTPTYNSKNYILINNGQYYQSETEIYLAQWRIYTLNAIELKNYTYVSLAVFFEIASLLLWFLIQYLSRAVASRQTRAVDKLLFAVRELQAGNMHSYVYLGTGDEFETLANQYNLMLERLNELLAKNAELFNLRRIIEVKHLQAQFHPHFIFNVLETLRYAIVVDNKQAQDIVLLLSRLLRYSISTDGMAVPLKEDLNYVADYLRLQQMRFNERLQYAVDVSEEARGALVPRLLLQAVIENSIKYGYRTKEFLTISVKGQVMGAELIIEVKDDGGGMSEERLQQVRDILQHSDNSSPHIGLNNLHRRLVLLYGESYGVRMESTSGEGTVVTINIPYGKEAGELV